MAIIGATRGHVERMKRLEMIAMLAVTGAQSRFENMAATKFYRAEAEIWLAVEKGK